MTGHRLRVRAHRAVQAARAQLGRDPAATRPSHSVRVRLRVEPELIDDVADLVRRVEGRAVRGEEFVTVPFAPGRDSSGAVSELRRVLDRWADRYPGVQVDVLPNEDSGHDLAAAAGTAAGRGMLAVTTVARRLGNARLPQRSRRAARRAARAPHPGE